MKKLLVMASLLGAVSAFSQGTVNFNNYVTMPDGLTIVRSRVTYGDGGPVTVGSNVTSSASIPGTAATGSAGLTYGVNAQAGLYGGTANNPDTFVMLGSAVGFKSAKSAGLVLDTATSRTVDGTKAGDHAFVQIRAWDSGDASADYRTAELKVGATHGVYLGKSTVVEVILGGGSPPLPQAELVDITSGQAISGIAMTYTVPEPSMIALGILGGIAGLMVFRRRQ